MLAKVNESGIKDLSVNCSTSGFQQDDNYEFSNRALQHGYSVSGPIFGEKTFSAATPEFILNSASAALGECHQFDHFFSTLRPGQFEGMQMQNDNLDITHRSIPSNASCLDHVEEITSYDTDGYDDRTISYGSSCSTIPASYPYISPLQRNNHISDTRDCSWTALMQESLEVSNSNNGLNEDCSDLTFSNTEFSGGNTLQNQVIWDNGCLTSPSFTSNFLPFPGDADATFTSSSTVSNLQNFVDLPHDMNNIEQDNPSSKLRVSQDKVATRSHSCQHRDKMHSAEWGTYPGNEQSSGLMPTTQHRQNKVLRGQFNSSVININGSDGSGKEKLHGLYESEEQMEIDSLLNSFSAPSDAFSQTYEIFQKSESFVDVDKKDKLEESVSVSCFNNTAPYMQAGPRESAIYNGSYCHQQFHSTSQVIGLFCTSASRQETTSSYVSSLPLCGPNSMNSLGESGEDHLLTVDHTLQHEQQTASCGTRYELIDDVANPVLEFTNILDGQSSLKRTYICHDGRVATNDVWKGRCDMTENSSLGVCSSNRTAHSQMELPVTHTTHVLPSPSLSNDPNSSFIRGTDHKKVELIGAYNSTQNYLELDNSERKGIISPKSFEQNVSENICSTTAEYQCNDYSQIVGNQKRILHPLNKASHSSGLPTNKFDGKLVSPEKKRKRSTSLLSWQAQVMSGCCKMHHRRTPELDWAHATRRLVEKVDAENTTAKDSTFVSRAQKRLALTTSLIQCILPALPHRLLAANAINSGETIVYHTSQLALSDAFNPVVSSISKANNFMLQNQTGTSGNKKDKIIPEVLETFTMRFDELQRSFSRAERATTFQDLTSETRDLERWSILHHFIKLHRYSRLHEDGISNPRPNPCRSTIRKHAEAVEVPVDLLGSVRCRLLN
ncbi:uncharacterized protein LOC102702080 [Oryza brachyantha]|uniref:Uncharacterized protein n=1 Tax=Oryza brachyantha TaxID=4533 RepID=J3LSZ0_ORYBR|nr:uncharacterized protein LOC102702080 [Oryza brachyantha]